jgi:hypothetical protein
MLILALTTCNIIFDFRNPLIIFKEILLQGGKNLSPLNASCVYSTALLGVIVRNKIHICIGNQNMVLHLVKNVFLNYLCSTVKCG